MFQLVKVSADNQVKFINCKSRTIPLKTLQDAVQGNIEIVHVANLPDLAMVVNEYGYYTQLPFNAVASGLYGDPNAYTSGSAKGSGL